MSMDFDSRRNVTAVLGPTNTGKTHLAIERMLGHETGMIGLPLRLLAREVYDKIANRVGRERVALITGEEKIKPESPRYWVSTVEAMPRGLDVDFLAIDEIQLCADPERGHVFTDRLLHARGRRETLLLGASTMRDAIADVVPGANFISRPRLSKLTYSGEKKLTRLPKRTAVVAFSAGDVYAIAELIRRQLGGAAVVLGALSPRTRNAQVALYQSGDVDYIVATDAIGMGLNLDVDHVAFAAVRKFDGQNFRNLTPGELAQIAGRAGRHMNDGTFGVTGDVPGFEQDIVERLETHTFDAIKTLQWRSRDLDFSTVGALRESLRRVPQEARLVRARMADDVMALETVSGDPEILERANNRAAVSLLWDVCQIPDYRRISSQNHAELVSTLYKYLTSADGKIPEDWFSKQVAFADRIDGDIDTLANRIAHIRTWTFVSNRPEWLADPEHWQGRARAIEDALSDALHERLTQRFVDRRTSALMKGMRDKDELTADIAEDGAIQVENHFVGRLRGFRFTPDAQADGIHGKATRQAAAQVVAKEMSMRARRVAAAKPDAFKLSRTARILWRDEEIGRLEPGENPLQPQVVLLADEHLSGPDREKVQERLQTWTTEIIADRLKPLVELGKAEDVTGLARGIAFRLVENFGLLKRDTIGEELKSLDQNARAQLRKYGVRFGAFNVYIPLLLKPAPTELRATLWALKNAQTAGLSLDALPEAPRPGLTSILVNTAIPEPFYRVHGFHVCGPRVVRIDMLERLADQIRPLVAWRAPAGGGTPPRGATGDGGFLALPEMMSILGCSADELGGVLKALGFWCERRPKKAEPPKPAAVAEEATPSEAPVTETTGDGEIAADTTEPAALTLEATDAVEPAAETSALPPEAASAPEIMAPEPEAPAAEAAATEPAATDAPATTEAASTEVAGGEPEVVFEEVWRPRRRHQRGQRPERRPQERAGDRPRQHQGKPHGQGRGPRDRGEARQQAPVGGAPDQPTTSATAETGAPAGEERARGDRQRDNRNRDRNDRDRGERRDRPEGRPPRQGGDRERRDDRPRGGGGGGDRRPDRRDRGERPPIIARSGPSPNKGADPDSPFAALGALKQALEKRARETGGG
jgi:ATP-dependent RNA helicase SUPV3L1/SUV3